MAERAELDAVARGGSEGRAAYERAQALLAAQKKAAIGAAIAEAAQRGAPAGMQAEISGTVGAPYDRQIGNLAQASASRTAELAQLSAGNAAYMGQVAAAGPAMRSALERRVAARRAKASQGDALSDSELSKRLLGAAAVEREQARRIAPIAGGVASSVGGAVGGALAGPLGGILGRAGGSVASKAEIPLETRARQLGVGAGIDPNRVYGVVGEPEAPKPPKAAKPAKAPTIDKYAKRAGLSDRHATDLRRNANYQRAIRFLRSQVAAEQLTRESLAQLLNSKYLRNREGIKRLLAAEAEEYL